MYLEGNKRTLPSYRPRPLHEIELRVTHRVFDVGYWHRLASTLNRVCVCVCVLMVRIRARVKVKVKVKVKVEVEVKVEFKVRVRIGAHGRQVWLRGAGKIRSVSHLAS